MSHFNRRNAYRTSLISLAALSGLPAVAYAQDSGPETSPETTLSNVSEFLGPQDLPGRPKGERELPNSTPVEKVAPDAPDETAPEARS